MICRASGRDQQETECASHPRSMSSPTPTLTKLAQTQNPVGELLSEHLTRSVSSDRTSLLGSSKIYLLFTELWTTLSWHRYSAFNMLNVDAFCKVLHPGCYWHLKIVIQVYNWAFRVWIKLGLFLLYLFPFYSSFSFSFFFVFFPHSYSSLFSWDRYHLLDLK